MIPWCNDMSDGCSVPQWIRVANPIIDQACVVGRSCCVDHDHAYYLGGTELDRLWADYTLRA